MAQASELAGLLKQIAAAPAGLLKLIQVLDSVQGDPMLEPAVAEFFDDLLLHCRAVDASGGWAHVWDTAWVAVACGVSPHATRPGGHVRRLAPPPGAAAPAAVLTTLINEDHWQTFHVAACKDEGVELGLPLPQLIGADAELIRRWSAVLQRGGWSQPTNAAAGAWLGRPSDENANCWVSCNQVAPAEPGEQRPEVLANLLDALGLPVTNPLLAWVQYTVHPDRLLAGQGDPSVLGARPGFADLGSEWFQVRGEGSAAQRHRRHGWGSTVNLAQVRKSAGRAAGNVDGVGLPERVIPAVRVDSPAVDPPTVFPAPGVGTATMMTPKHRAAFLRQALGLRRKSDIVRDLLRLLRRRAGPAPASAEKSKGRET